MREIVFLVAKSAATLQTKSESPSLTVRSSNLEELHHAARDALIEHFGPSHGAYKVRFKR